MSASKQPPRCLQPASPHPKTLSAKQRVKCRVEAGGRHTAADIGMLHGILDRGFLRFVLLAFTSKA